MILTYLYNITLELSARTPQSLLSLENTSMIHVWPGRKLFSQNNNNNCPTTEKMTNGENAAKLNSNGEWNVWGDLECMWKSSEPIQPTFTFKCRKCSPSFLSACLDFLYTSWQSPTWLLRAAFYWNCRVYEFAVYFDVHNDDLSPCAKPAVGWLAAGGQLQRCSGPPARRQARPSCYGLCDPLPISDDGEWEYNWLFDFSFKFSRWVMENWFNNPFSIFENLMGNG